MSIPELEIPPTASNKAAARFPLTLLFLSVEGASVEDAPNRFSAGVRTVPAHRAVPERDRAAVVENAADSETEHAGSIRAIRAHAAVP